MYVEQKTLGDLGRFKLRKIFSGNPIKRVVKAYVGVQKDVAKLAVKSVLAPTMLASKAISKAFPMPKGPVDIPADSPAGPLMVSADPYVNQMGPGYQTYPAAVQSDYYPGAELPPQDGQYLNPDMQQNGAPETPEQAQASAVKKKVLLLGTAGALAAYLFFKRRG